MEGQSIEKRVEELTAENGGLRIAIESACESLNWMADCHELTHAERSGAEKLVKALLRHALVFSNPNPIPF